MAIPSSPLPDRILVQTYFPNSLFKADFNRPATACNAHQIGEWLCAGGVGMIIDHFVRQTDTASCNERKMRCSDKATATQSNHSSEVPGFLPRLTSVSTPHPVGRR